MEILIFYHGLFCQLKKLELDILFNFEKFVNPVYWAWKIICPTEAAPAVLPGKGKPIFMFLKMKAMAVVDNQKSRGQEPRAYVTA